MLGQGPWPSRSHLTTTQWIDGSSSLLGIKPHRRYAACGRHAHMPATSASPHTTATPARPPDHQQGIAHAAAPKQKTAGLWWLILHTGRHRLSSKELGSVAHALGGPLSSVLSP